MSLPSLPAELLSSLCAHLPLESVGRLACVCREMRDTLATDDAWRQTLELLGAPAWPAARHAVRSLLTLSEAQWKLACPAAADDGGAQRKGEAGAASLESLDGCDPPRARQHSAFVSCCGGQCVVLFGGQLSTQVREGYGVVGQTFAYDVSGRRWYSAPSGPHVSPRARTFSADDGGARVLRDAAGREWLCIFGGLVSHPVFPGRVSYRDNETWLLGPLGPAATVAKWRWVQIQEDGAVQSPARPRARFHHTLTTVPGVGVNDADRLWVFGGNDRNLQPICEAAFLTLDPDIGRLLERNLTVDAPDNSAIPDSDEPHAHDGEFLSAVDRLGSSTRWSFPLWPDVPVDDVYPPRWQPPIEARADHSAAFWPAGRRLIVVGGRHGSDMPVQLDCLAIEVDRAARNDKPRQPNDPSTQWTDEDAALTPLPSLPTARACASLSICGDWAILCGGIRQSHSRPESYVHATDVLVLDLAHAVSHGDSAVPRGPSDTATLSRKPKRSQGRWAQLNLQPSVPRCKPFLVPILASRMVLVLGGYEYNAPDLDRYGDPTSGHLALHETVGVALPSCMLGLAHQQLARAPLMPSAELDLVGSLYEDDQHAQGTEEEEVAKAPLLKGGNVLSCTAGLPIHGGASDEAVGMRNRAMILRSFIVSSKSRALIHGLTGSAAARFNGTLCNILSKVHGPKDNQRHHVRCEGGQHVKIKPQNLEPSKSEHPFSLALLPLGSRMAMGPDAPLSNVPAILAADTRFDIIHVIELDLMAWTTTTRDPFDV